MHMYVFDTSVDLFFFFFLNVKLALSHPLWWTLGFFYSEVKQFQKGINGKGMLNPEIGSLQQKNI